MSSVLDIKYGYNLSHTGRIVWQFSSEFKAKVAFAALKGDKALSQISSEFGVHCTQVSAWNKVIQKRLSGLFKGKSEQKNSSNEKLIDELYQNIDDLNLLIKNPMCDNL